MAGAVPVLGPAGQVAAVYGLPRPGAFHWGGVDNPDVIGPQTGVADEHPDQPADRGGQIAQPLVVPRLLRTIREYLVPVGGGEPEPAGLAGEPHRACITA